MPEPARSYVRMGAEAIGCDPSFIVLPLLAGLAGAIGNSRCITLKRGWSESAIIWAAIVGESGTTKTPALRYALRPVYDRQHRLMRDHEQEESRWQAEQMLHEAKLTKWKKDAARGKTTAEPPPAPEQPVCPRVWIEDTTTEALASLLQDNPRGLLAIYNELSGWFSFGRYSNGNGAGEIARWLEMFDAGQIMVDRKTTGRVYVPRASVSIAGAIQPRILERSVGELHRENGLLARLLIAYPPRRAKRWTETEADPRLDAQMAAVFDRLYDLEPDLDTDGEPVPRALPLMPISPRLMALLLDRLEISPERSSHLVTIASNGAVIRRVRKIWAIAGVEPWPRLWQTLRSSCEKQWAMTYPQYAVSKWIGHSITVSGRHYVTAVPDELFDRAAGLDATGTPNDSSQRNAQQKAHATPGNA